MSNIYSVCVVGGGAAGIMATLRCVLNNDDTLFFSGNKIDRRKSREFWVSKVENIPGFFNFKNAIKNSSKDTIEWIQESKFSKNLNFKKNKSIVSIVKENKLFKIVDEDNNTFFSKYVILCTGVMDMQPEINGSIKPILPYANIQLADYCLRCDGHHTLGKKTTIISDGGDSGAWVSIMLMERYNCPQMTILTNGKSLNLSKNVENLLSKYNIKTNTQKIIDIQGNLKEKKMQGFVLENSDFIDSEICFISLGMIVYNELAKGLGADLDQRGFVKTDQKGESSIENLFIAGDLRAAIKKQIYTAWDSAVDSADKINMLIRQEKRLLK